MYKFTSEEVSSAWKEAFKKCYDVYPTFTDMSHVEITTENMEKVFKNTFVHEQLEHYLLKYLNERLKFRQDFLEKIK